MSGTRPRRLLLERHRVVDPLADVDPLAEQILVDVRRRARVEIEAGVAREDVGERGDGGANGRHVDARLEDRVAGGHATRARLELGPVERMREGRDEAAGRAAGKLGVRVQRDHEPGRRKEARIAHVPGKAGLLIAGEQAVEFGKLPALAFPAHPATLAGVPQSPTMQQVKRTAVASPVPRIQRADALLDPPQQIDVTRHRFLGGVGEGDQQREMEVGVGAGEPVNLEPRHDAARRRLPAREGGA